jgi:hypothetical protein
MAATPAGTDDVFEVNLQTLKVREIEEIEEIIGCGFDVAFAPGAPKGKVMRALAWVTRKRTDPEFTLEQAGEMVIKLAEAEPDPTTAPAS